MQAPAQHFPPAPALPAPWQPPAGPPQREGELFENGFDRRVDEFARPAMGGTTARHPFSVVDASSGGVARVRVVFGQVNSITPTIGGTAINHSTPPTLTVSSGVVYLKVTLDGDGLVTAAEILNAASLPAQEETYGYLTLAAVTVSGGAVTAIDQSVTHSLGHQKCGTTVHNFWGL